MTNPHIRQCPECGENCLQCVGTYTEWWEDNHLRLAQDEPKITIKEEREESNGTASNN
jgi:primosomal protein N'